MSTRAGTLTDVARQDARDGARRHDGRRRLRGRARRRLEQAELPRRRPRRSSCTRAATRRSPGRSRPRRAGTAPRGPRRSPSCRRARPRRWASRGRPLRAPRATACRSATDAGMTRIVQQRCRRRPALHAAGASARASTTWPRCARSGTDGLVGAWSAARALRVVHYRLPPGAFVARDGAVVLPYGASLPLTDGDGLELAYENVRPGAAARRRRRPLLGEARRTAAARRRRAGAHRAPARRDARRRDPRDARAPRSCARTSTCSRGRREPRDPIDVRAVVSDPSGHVDVSNETITLEAMKDLDPVPVAWQHTRQRLDRAHRPARRHGPVRRPRRRQGRPRSGNRARFPGDWGGERKPR